MISRSPTPIESTRRKPSGTMRRVSDERVAEPGEGDERTILLGWLAFHRDALAAKCRGLSDAQLVSASVAPSTLTCSA
jgi:hypothetical protein